MITDKQLVDIAAACYDPAAAWDWSCNTPEGIWLRMKMVEGVTVIAYPGSVTMQDWFNDFAATTMDSRLGRVHKGFFTGLEAAYDQVKPLIIPPVVCTGHSLGAARAVLTAGLLALDRVDLQGVVVFGEPRSGMQELTDILKPYNGRSYKNRHDPVTGVPFRLPGFPYQHVWPLSGLDVKPADDGVLADHHIANYVAGLTP